MYAIRSYYVEQLIALKSTLSVPVIASLNAVTLGGWVDIARQLESAGADVDVDAAHAAMLALADPEVPEASYNFV